MPPVHVLRKRGRHVNPLGGKGIGESALVGIARHFHGKAAAGSD
jgi:hypothetical protein